MTQLICTTATTVASCHSDANFGSWIPTLHTMIPGVRDIETATFSGLRRPNETGYKSIKVLSPWKKKNLKNYIEIKELSVLFIVI